MSHFDKGNGKAACGASSPLGTVSWGDEHGNSGTYPINNLVTAALASDCDDCRTAVGVALVGDKTWGGRIIGVREIPEWEPQPMAVEILDYVANRRG